MPWGGVGGQNIEHPHTLVIMSSLFFCFECVLLARRSSGELHVRCPTTPLIKFYDEVYEPRHEKTCLCGLDQVRLKSACSATELIFFYLCVANICIILSRQRTTKTLIRQLGLSRLICAFVVGICHKTGFLMARRMFTYFISWCYNICCI